MIDSHKIDEVSFVDHFDNNIMERPKTWWRKAWNWQPLYWLRCHTFTKYHMVDCRTPTYRWGWIDRSEMLLYANFNILVEFIELEKPDKFIDWRSDPEHSHAWDEMMYLYTWWKHERQAELNAMSLILNEVQHQDWDDMFESIPQEENGEKYWTMKPLSKKQEEMYDRYGAEEQRLEKKDQDNLHRLIEIRKYLWT